jgi:hypothetical protein
MTIHECPKCGKPMEYEEGEPDVGIVGGWLCMSPACGHVELDVDEEGSP